MKTALYRHRLCSLHDAGPGHPENPERLAAIEKQIAADGLLDRLIQLEPPLATRQQLSRVHDATYLERIFGLSPAHGLVHLDGDTAMNPHTLQSALLAAGGAIDATDRVLDGRFDNAFCCMRPPGHHAEPSRAMGFCLFGNIAVAAAHALAHHGLERVAILDFDVHHGNGTEAIFRTDSRVLFCSSFQHPFYPYTDIANAPAHVVHTPLPSGTGSAAFRKAIEEQWLPAVNRHKPQMIFVSAGFDAHRDDPLGGLEIDEADFAWVTHTIRTLADRHCNGRIVSVLEGGYDRAALGHSVSAHLSGLLACPAG